MGSTVATTPQTHLNRLLGKLKGQVEAALPSHLNADRMCRLALTAFSTNPALQKCSMESIAACVMLSSQLGLEIGVNGQAYMIPYKTTATFVPGWKGLIDLVNRAGNAAAWTGAVFEGDEFDWALGDEPFVHHKPSGESDPTKMTHVYAVGKINSSGAKIIDCWPNEKVAAHRNKYNKVGQRHYSFQHWEMYARKVVLLQVLKYLPQSVELNQAVEVANKVDSGPIIDGEVLPVAANITSLDELTDEIADSKKGSKKSAAKENLESKETDDLTAYVALLKTKETTDDVEACFQGIEAEIAKTKPKNKAALLRAVKSAVEERLSEVAK